MTQLEEIKCITRKISTGFDLIHSRKYFDPKSVDQ